MTRYTDEEGNVYARGSFRPSSMDLAEYFRVDEPVEPGDVLAVDLEHPGLYRRAMIAGDPAIRLPYASTEGSPFGEKGHS